jgi:biopolymer transport protein ExbB/TolQ
MNALSTIATFYKQGGIFMHAVLVLAIVIAAIVVERMIVIGRAAAVDGRKLTDDLVQRAGRGDLNGARQSAMSSHTPLARVAQEMLQTGFADEETLQTSADDATTMAMPELTRRLTYLGMLANSATLIGLLGTITGLITAISGIGVADAAQRSAHLASGISEALHTTAFGLTVAIPTLLIQGWFSGRVDGIAESIDELSIRLSKAMAKVAAGHNAGHGGPVAIARPQASRVAPPAATGTLGSH